MKVLVETDLVMANSKYYDWIYEVFFDLQKDPIYLSQVGFLFIFARNFSVQNWTEYFFSYYLFDRTFQKLQEYIIWKAKKILPLEK